MPWIAAGRRLSSPKVAAVTCRVTRRSLPWLLTAGAAAFAVGGLGLPLGAAPVGATTTTVPSAANPPTSSQIQATQSQVATIEATIAQEQQKTAVLDQQYDGALQSEQRAQAEQTITKATLAADRVRLAHDRATLAQDAVNVYVYGGTGARVPSLFANSASSVQAVTVYQDTALGDLTDAVANVQTEQGQLAAALSHYQTEAEQAAAAATQLHTLAAENAQATAATQATLHQVQGTLAQQVAAQAQAQAQAEAAAAAAAQNAAAAQQAAAAAAAAAGVAGAVGGAGAAASATNAANSAAASAAGTSGNGGGSSPPTVGGSGSGGSAAAVSAAESQLGVPYVFGGESPGVGFDCSGLTQWAWAQAGVTIPRTAASQWDALPHVSLDSLEPGDLLFYYNLDGDNTVDHVVMYIGSGPYGSQTIIQAPYTGTTVSYSPVFTEDLIGAGRP